MANVGSDCRPEDGLHYVIRDARDLRKHFPVKFIETTADMPDDLIVDALAGRVVFLCGAGISMRVGLPSFKGLTDRIYEELGETFENDPPEKDAYDKTEYDRTLRALEKRLHRPGTIGSPVRAACADQLRVPVNVEFVAHTSVLTLSRDREGRSRVLTTNFDTLFERALASRGLPIVSEAGKALPKPGGPRDFGIHHLHGRLADPELRLAETDLILTSADFGDAYLRDGWASRYIEDRMRTATLVLLGYRAEDAALRLLLESLDVDRERFPDLNSIYALEQSSAGSAAQWRAKGVIPIEFATRDALYDTLTEWARYASHPADFERERIRTILAKPPGEVTEFEKSQLKFCLERAELHGSMAANNPSLSWLPTLAALKLVRFDDRWLAAWIERNLSDPVAVTHIAASLGLFGPEIADMLEARLNQYPAQLPDYLRLSWTLLIRHMRNARQGLAMRGWYDLQPRLNKGDRSADMIERLTDLLKPRIEISKRFFLHDEKPEAPEHPWDLMSIGYEPDEDIQIGEVIAAWSTDTAAADEQLLQSLCHALDASLNDAVEIGVESNTGYGTTDGDVPSVADHPQNAYRKGFLPIVRVAAEVWSRLAGKDAVRARAFVSRWIASRHRLNHRLAMFACTNDAIGPDLAGEVLQALPRGEIFLTGGTVEVYRLLRSRWNELSAAVRDGLEARFRDGPPADWFRAGSDVARYQDRSRYDLIGNLVREGIPLSDDTRRVFDEIAARWPQWGLRPAGQAGFHSWSESGSGEIGDPGQLDGVADQDLVDTALRLDAEADFGEGQTWRALCQSDPNRALRGLEAQADANVWRSDAWQQLLWSSAAPTEPDAPARIAQRLLAWPQENFAAIASQASSWLEKPEALALGEPGWALWDKVFAGIEVEAGNDEDESPLRLLDRSLNVPIGRLTEILLRKLPTDESAPDFATNVRPRLEAVFHKPGRNGLLARVRMAVEVTVLFDRAPTWTAANVIPLFGWESRDAAASWCARHYSRYIGTPELFSLTKTPFLQLFGRTDMPEEAVQVYSEWLVTILITNRRNDDVRYDLSATEARAALRRVGPNMLRSVGHRLAREMEAAPSAEKLTRWREIVGPVFQGIWPLDIDMQTGSSTFKLLQILRATGDAFPEAVDVILPFVRPENRDHGTGVYSLSDADEILYTSAPAKMLSLVSAAVGAPPAGTVFGLARILDRIRGIDPALADTHMFRALIAAAA